MKENELIDIESKLTNKKTERKFKIFGSSLFFDDPHDFDIAIYDLRVGFEISKLAKEQNLKIHIVPIPKEGWDKLRNITTFNNTAAEFYQGKIIYGDNYTNSKVLSVNNNSIAYFDNFAVIMKTRMKLLKRGFSDLDENEDVN